MRLVVDTNLWVSYLLKPNSLIAPQIEIIQREETLLYSRATLEELSDVLSRAKFAKYVDCEDVHTFIMAFIETGEHVTVSREIKACRDPSSLSDSGCATAEKRFLATKFARFRQIATAILLKRANFLSQARFPSLRAPKSDKLLEMTSF